ncbi:ATP-dependent 5'-3' DNA helicase HCS1 [Ascoidea rubescens DSM 1968]|uniref:DNA helicase n=1 Tax=Ascoidea rubescens DSM 1968 TaxID=1344418 RepID=A0A1D2VAU7_9ASCO|nr:DNA helicase [Ascoidea rubescens DSM 1968]ODV58720.1 DNA helicase [Ascoidea rubescens DSM 1968]
MADTREEEDVEHRNEKFVDQFLQAIDLEKKSDIELTSELLSSLSYKKLAQRGLAIINLTIDNIKTGLNGRILIELSNDKAYSNSASMGDIVKLEKLNVSGSKSVSKLSSKSSKNKKNANTTNNNNNIDNDIDQFSIQGIIIRFKSTSITVSIDHDNNDLNNKKNIDEILLNLSNQRLWLVKVSNSITYKRMNLILSKMKQLMNTNSFKSSNLIQLIIGNSKFIPPSSLVLNLSLSNLEFLNKNLNDSQKLAINFSLNSDLSIIHGPPGTGKTFTLIEIIYQLFLKNQRILICGPSNISIDTILERLVHIDQIPKDKILRIGHPARLLSSIQYYSLDYVSKNSNQGQVISEIYSEIESTFKKIKKSKNYNERKPYYSDIKSLRYDLRQREKKVLNELILNSKIIVATLHGSGSKELMNLYLKSSDTGEFINQNLFDALIIDEVSQSLEPQCWIPIISHKDSLKKLIIAGDNKQLPPTIKLEKNDKYMKLLETTLFDRLIKTHNSDDIKYLLNTQYRMNSQIMKFSSEFLYEGKLIADDSVKDHLVCDLPYVEKNEDTSVPVIWYDTQGGDFPEGEEDLEKVENKNDNKKIDSIFSSKYNENEVNLVYYYINLLIKSKVSQESIGVISPYNAQISLLKLKIHSNYPAIEISTVDGFQGREKDVIILSLVRSNEKAEVGFLKDERRLNVAITRPRRQLCVIGDMETLTRSNNKFLKKWVNWAEEEAEIRYPDLSEILQ